ncbi:unnamed protein product [Cyclocybe aegerita]|uniref:Uncharacterized protein n=1 Tax=Cyclocybe aegerita TaxID=1973307 RepID=A0A8S0X6V9_CYCAE|nr:unnamed protein product [Cyclocybe aegerita]
MRSILVFLLSLFLVPVLAAPVDKPKQAQAPVEHKIGDFVGVRPSAYEEKTIDNKRVTIHPGVVLSGPHPVTGKYEVAMISKKLPHDPPQAPVGQFHPGSSAYGNVSLGPAKQVSLQHLKPWKDEKTGQRQDPMTHENVQKLKAAMAPHAGWKPPPPPPTPAVPPKPASPTAKGGQHPNAHASGSKHPSPGRPGRSPQRGKSPQKSRSRSPQKGPSRRQGPPHNAKGKRPASPRPPAKKPAGKKRSLYYRR